MSNASPKCLEICWSQKTIVPPQISLSSSRKGCSCRGLQLTLSLDKRAAVLRYAFSTAISTTEVLTIGDGLLSPPLLCLVKIRSPPLRRRNHSVARRGGSGWQVGRGEASAGSAQV